MRQSSMINELVETLGLQTNLATYDVPREDLPKTTGSAEGPLYSEVSELLESRFTIMSHKDGCSTSSKCHRATEVF